MTLALRIDFLRDLLFKHLTKDTKFPTDLLKSGHPLQIIQVLFPRRSTLMIVYKIQRKRKQDRQDSAYVGDRVGREN
jgi:hypothetical protein